MKTEFRLILCSFLLLLFSGCVTLQEPLRQTKSCSYGEMTEKIERHLELRLQALRPLEKYDDFMQSADVEIKELQQLLKQLGEDSNKRGNIQLICDRTDRLIAKADDVLAGGDGNSLPLKNPWQKHTPEALLTIREETLSLCEEEKYKSRCYNDTYDALDIELHTLYYAMKDGSMTAEDTVDQSYEIYNKFRTYLLEQK